ncbi:MULTISPECIES: hypothetical protein [unclassified Bradyrhizobium]|uniref:hypothetical protein n=1 Tax=unclassified Bradyrhizobium TaxID=2631580 RepID=UPI0028E2B0B7|nr:MULTISPECIES: hypothetical protein [unclassified Bradyrhizobium]
MAALPATIVDTTPKSLRVGSPIADAGFPEGFRLSNLGGRRELYIRVPQGVELNLAELVLAYDDVSAHEARRSLEILANDRSIAALTLDGRGTGRTARISLANVSAREGFLKLSFVYSGAATQDRCIDVRYVGDSVTIRPETMVDFALGLSGTPNIAATAALMPRDVGILLSSASPPAADIATALTIARSLKAAGRTVSFHHGKNGMPDMVDQDNRGRWTRGLIVVGSFDEIADRLDGPTATLVNYARGAQTNNALAAGRIGGVPVLLATDSGSSQIGRLLGDPSLLALRDTPTASIGSISAARKLSDRISFNDLGLTAPRVDVFGRAELLITIASQSLPAGTRPSRLVLDVMVAPDGAGEKAVVSAFVNEHLLASTVAAIGGPTRLDFALPEGLVGTIANVRTVVQRRSSQGDCRFEPQGYPAELLGSSQVMLSPAGPAARDFSDLVSLWGNGIQILLPASTADRPLSVLASLSNVVSGLSNRTTPIEVTYVDARAAAAPSAPFISVGNSPPAGADQRVRFDRGRVAITDRSERVLLDVGGMTTGAVAQIVTANGFPGLWIRPLSGDGSLSASPAINLDRGDVAFLDRSGVALALSSYRDTLLRVTYADQPSWTANLDRGWPWIVGITWVLATLALLMLAQRMYRRRAARRAGE